MAPLADLLDCSTMRVTVWLDQLRLPAWGTAATLRQAPQQCGPVALLVGFGGQCSLAVTAQDSLTPLAMIVDASLGDGQPVAAMVRQLAEANMSKAARAARQEKQRAAEVSCSTSVQLPSIAVLQWGVQRLASRYC